MINEKIRWASIQPLTGGMYLGAEEAIGHPAEFILSYKGLSDKQIQESRAKFGTNDLTPPQRESWVKLLVGKFNDPMIKLLLFATLLSFITGYFHGSIVESLGILIAVFLATFISFINSS